MSSGAPPDATVTVVDDSISSSSLSLGFNSLYPDALSLPSEIASQSSWLLSSPSSSSEGFYARLSVFFGMDMRKPFAIEQPLHSCISPSRLTSIFFAVFLRAPSWACA